jgi:quinol monooxygenase YgiN
MAELVLIARFHARPGMAEDMRAAIADVARPTKAEEGCLHYEVLASASDADLFFIHSRWRDHDAFENHAALPHTVAFVERVSRAIDHPFEAYRLRVIG